MMIKKITIYIFITLCALESFSQYEKTEKTKISKDKYEIRSYKNRKNKKDYKYELYWENDKDYLVKRYFVVNDLLEGPYIFFGYDKDTNTFIKKCIYKKQKLHGLYHENHEDGTLYEKGIYHGKTRIGKWERVSYSRENKYKEEYDSTGRLHGEYIKTNAQGSVLTKGNYIHGKKIGHWIEKGQDSDGPYFFDYKYDSKRRYDSLYFVKTAVSLDSGFYDHGKKIGHWIEKGQDSDGPYFSEYNYDSKGKYDGSYFRKTGVSLERGLYSHGKKVGKWEFKCLSRNCLVDYELANYDKKGNEIGKYLKSYKGGLRVIKSEIRDGVRYKIDSCKHPSCNYSKIEQKDGFMTVFDKNGEIIDQGRARYHHHYDIHKIKTSDTIIEIYPPLFKAECKDRLYPFQCSLDEFEVYLRKNVEKIWKNRGVSRSILTGEEKIIRFFFRINEDGSVTVDHSTYHNNKRELSNNAKKIIDEHFKRYPKWQNSLYDYKLSSQEILFPLDINWGR